MTLDPALVDDPTVGLDGVSKWFGQKVAVSGVSCSFGPGVTGLLGPNGAGKTTMLRMITGLTLPSQGSVTVLGELPRSHPRIYKSVGLVPEEDAVYPHLTGLEYVRYAADLMKVPGSREAARRAIGLVDLTEDADRRLGGYSKGMRQRAKVAAALVADPSVLVLDEPLNGTDPLQRVHLIDIFRRLGAEGRTVIMSSHILEEVERTAERVIAIVDGKLAAAGDIAAIRRAMADIPYRVFVATDRPREMALEVLANDVVGGVTLADGGLHVETRDVGRLGKVVPVAATSVQARITRFEPEDESLESVFRYLVRGR